MTGDERLDELLDALSRTAPGEADREVPPEILRAFAVQAAANQSSSKIPSGGRARTRRHRVGFATKTAVCALVVSSGAVTAAAAADDLPASAQSVAHSMFGSLGVPAPAPSRHPPTSRPKPRPKATPSPTAPSPTAHIPPGQTHTSAVGHGQTKKSSATDPPTTSSGPGNAFGHTKSAKH